jgi:hypothetical protein
MRARLHKLLEESEVAGLVSGHGFSRANQLFVFDFDEADFSPTSRQVRVFGSLLPTFLSSRFTPASYPPSNSHPEEGFSPT